MGYKQAKLIHEVLDNEGSENETFTKVKEVSKINDAKNSKVGGKRNFVHHCTHDFPITEDNECFPCKREEI